MNSIRYYLPKCKVIAFPTSILLAFTGAALAQAVFVPTGSMNAARANQTATLLNSGQVLIAGGNAAAGLASAELYDPATGTFTPTGSMTTPRTGHTATLLTNGKVLIAGGQGATLGPTDVLASAELYDPATGTFTATGSMSAARVNQTATLLNSGLVLVAGGCNPCGAGALSSAELYNPATGTFLATSSMTAARNAHTATLLTNGKVLVAGGFSGSAVLASAELYDPTTGTFAATASMTTARWIHSATLLMNGQVLIAGGSTTFTGTASSSAELYVPATGTFTATGSTNAARWGHTATLLTNGQLLIAGGTSGSSPFLSSAELYNPTGGIFSATGSMTAARHNHRATLLMSLKVLIAGGFSSSNSNSFLASAELYVPVLQVNLDIKPGSSPNSINLGSAGTIPAAILSTPIFDAPAEVEPDSLHLAGAAVNLIGKSGRFQCSIQDVNDDGLPDLVCHFNTAQFFIEVGDSIAVLEGQTFSGQAIRGEDSVRIVPDQ